MIVSDLERLSALYRSCENAGVVLEHPTCENVEECAFAGAVAAYYADLFIALEVVCEVVKIAGVSIIKAEILAIDDLGSKPGGTFHRLHADLLLGIYLRSPVLEVIERVDPISGLARTCARRASDPLQFAAEDVADLVGLCVVVRYALFALLQEVLIVTFICIYGSMVQFHDGVAHSVEEISVMRHHEKGAA